MQQPASLLEKVLFGKDIGSLDAGQELGVTRNSRPELVNPPSWFLSRVVVVVVEVVVVAHLCGRRCGLSSVRWLLDRRRRVRVPGRVR